MRTEKQMRQRKANQINAYIINNIIHVLIIIVTASQSLCETWDGPKEEENLYL